MRAHPLIPLLLASLAALQTPAQDTQSTAAHGAYRIAGSVVSMIDSHPLQHATVEMLAPDANLSVVEATTSDEYGRFAFSGVPAGNHILRGVTHNYLRTEYDEHEGFTTGIVSGAGVDTESLILKLAPASIIAGTIRDETGDAVANAIVHLFRQMLGQGDGRITNAGFAPTDDRGRFEFARLQPGTYFLVVTARPWYAVYPQPEQPYRGSEIAGGVRFVPETRNGVVDSIDPSLNVAFPAYFYPGTTDPAAATPIQLRGGESLDLGLRLSSVPAVSITIPVVKGINPEQQLMLPFHGENLPVQSQEFQSDGETTLTGIAPGSYILYSPNGGAPRGYTPFSPAGAGNSFSMGAPIHISGDMTLDQPSSTYAHVHAVIHAVEGSPLPAAAALIAIKTNSTDAVSGRVDPKGEVTLDLPPGDYTLQVEANGRPFAIRQALSGAKTLPGNQLHVAADDPATLSLFLSAADHILNGVARYNGKPFGGAFVLMIPSDQPITTSVPARDQSNLDGSFQLSRLGPGTYTLIAIDGGWDLDWRRPEVLARYLPGAVTVHIADAAEKIQTLHQPLSVQPR